MKRDRTMHRGEKAFFRCRLAGEKEQIYAYGVTTITNGTLVPGIIMAPFDPDSETALLFGTDSKVEWEKQTPLFRIPERGTLREEHIARVEEEIEILRSASDATKEAGNDTHIAKTVLARTKVITTASEGREIYDSLCEAYPETFVFHGESAQSGQWIGASPELLCRTRENKLFTVALAGTRVSGTGGKWDLKNIEEQRVVAAFIMETLNKYCESVAGSAVYTRQAGPVEHLCCDITATLPTDTSPEERLRRISQIVSALSPTPALSGFPRSQAIREIKRLEEFERGFISRMA